jgi:hypothetical protein
MAKPSMAHRQAVLRRERELAAELFRPATEEEKREIARRLSTPARALEAALPDPQPELPLQVAA